MTLKIDICCFLARHSALLRQGKDWLAQCQDNVNEWWISGHGAGCVVTQWGSSIKSPSQVGTIYDMTLDVEMK